MVIREYDYIKGSTAVKPERKIKKQNKRQKKSGILKKNRKQLQQQKEKQSNRKYAAGIAALIFLMGSATILGDSRVYKMQSNVSALNSEIKKMQEENEALKVRLLKFSSLSNIEDKAVSMLGMVTPNMDNTVKIDFSEDYFASLKGQEEQIKDSGLISKLINMIK